MIEDSRRKGLGRGLSALLGETIEGEFVKEAQRGSQMAPIESLVVNRYQPRQYFDPEELQSLTQSILENGMLMPILVRPVDNSRSQFEIVAGERRWRAAQAARLHEVPILVKSLDNKQALEVALIENVQRQDLSPLEEAEGYQLLMVDFQNTQESVARSVGKSRSHVANIMRLLGLPDAVKSLLRTGSLSAGHGRALLGAKDPIGFSKIVVNKGLNVRQTEKMVKTQQNQGLIPKQLDVPSKDQNTVSIEKRLSRHLGLMVKINHTGDRGEVRIAFKSLDQFDDILKRLDLP